MDHFYHVLSMLYCLKGYCVVCICKNPARISVCGLRFLFREKKHSYFLDRFKSKLTNTKTVTVLSKFQNEDGSANGNFNRSDELDDRTMKTDRNTQSIKEQV